jgi:hypothetical protein
VVLAADAGGFFVGDDWWDAGKLFHVKHYVGLFSG